MQAQYIELSKLSPNDGQIEGLPKNPRFIRDPKYAALVKSIQDDPEMLELRELIVYPLRGNFVVIAGNMRLRALNELGYKKALCKVLDEVTPLRKLKAFAIKDNIGFGEHDWGALANEWDAGELADWGLDVPVFDTPDYGDKNKEIDTDEMTDIMILSFKFQPGQYFEVKAALEEIAETPEDALLTLLENARTQVPV